MKIPTLIIISSLAVASQANLFMNPSFEDGSFAQDQHGNNLLPGSTAITGWDIAVSDIQWFSNSNSHGVVSSDGNLSLDITGGSDSTDPNIQARVSQMIATNIGSTYRISFDLGAQSQGGLASILVLADDVVGNTNLASQAFSDSTGSLTSVWFGHTLDFIATSGQTKISFVANRPGSKSIGLDNTSLIETNVVPEPATFAFLGLGAIAMIRRKK